eukprot:9503580-Pyramimonas_sp.AAC.1
MVLAGIRPEHSLENPEAPVVRGPTEVHEALAAYWGKVFRYKSADKNKIVAHLDRVYPSAPE